MENILDVTSVPVIVALVYTALAVYKKIVTSEKWIRLIPLWAALLGIALGVVAFYAIPEIMPADNILNAILIGGASGLAATGTNQLYKQLTKDKENN